MTHNDVKRRGILDRSATLLKVPLLKNMNYVEALEQSVKCVYGQNETTYYLADSSGAIIGSNDSTFTVPSTSVDTTTIPWTV